MSEHLKQERVPEYDDGAQYDDGSVYGGPKEDDGAETVTPEPDATEMKTTERAHTCPKCYGRRYVGRRANGSMIFCKRCCNISSTQAGVMYEMAKARRERKESEADGG